MAELPACFTQKLQKLYPSRYEDIIKSFSLYRPVTVRVNSIKCTINRLIAVFRRKGIKYQKINWTDEALIVYSDKKILTALEEYVNGCFYIQSLSSMLPVLALDPQPGEKILDMAAAPGSKTTQIAALMENTGEIIANDISADRLYKLKSNCERLGANNIVINNSAGQVLWQKFTNHFDRILVDVPCSMEGLFDTNNPKTIGHWSPKKVKNLAKLQRLLLRSAVGCVKPGGVVIYSTCTLSPEENEEVINWVLNKETPKVDIETVHFPGLKSINGLTGWGNKRYNSNLAKTKRIIPDAIMEGFFVAKLIKKI